MIHGRPWKLLTTDDLLYLPRNPRPHKAYGFGPVEQIVMTVNIALRRQAMQLQHFTEGNVPPGRLTAPEGWNVEQIRQFQEWFDSVLAGNSGSRARLVWAPAGTKYQAFKEAPYKDEFDEWLARIVCYAFSLPPTAFTRQINRATAETAQEAATAEGLAPLMGWVKRLADHVVQDRMGQADLEFAWVDLPADSAEQAKLLDLYVRSGIYTVNEARAALGFDPGAGGDRAMVYGTQGAMPLAAPPAAAKWAAAPLAKANYDLNEPRVPAGSPEGGEWTSEGDGGADAAAPTATPAAPARNVHVHPAGFRPPAQDRSIEGDVTAALQNAGYKLPPAMQEVARNLYRLFMENRGDTTAPHAYLKEHGLTVGDLPDVLRPLFDPARPLSELQTHKPPAAS